VDESKVEQAVIVVREFERFKEYITIRGDGGGKVVEFGNINAEANHEVFLSSPTL